MSDWYVVLEPTEARVVEQTAFGGMALEIVAGDEADAIEALEGWARSIETMGFVPEGLDWRNRAPAAIVRRSSRRSFRARVDTFEVETETGWTKGSAILTIREAPGD